MASLVVQLGERSYPIHVTNEGSQDLGAWARLRTRGNSAFMVTDQNVFPHAEAINGSLQRAGFATQLVTISPGEEQKSLASVAKLYDALAEMPADRQTLVVASGGGVIGDLAGFVAATYNRGLPLLMVPTTLLAMVDSSVGGKVGINHARGKNLIGAFHQPVGVWIDVRHLATLPDREFRSGFAEIVKYGAILDPILFEYLENRVPQLLARDAAVLEHVIQRSCELKASVVSQDERETTGLRAILNFGHTFAHAFETVAGYGAWLHGEAVAAGMVCASRLAALQGTVAPALTNRLILLLQGFGLPVTIPKIWPIPAMIKVMRSDKKAEAGRLRFILLRRLGEVFLANDVTEAQVAEVLREAGS